MSLFRQDKWLSKMRGSYKVRLRTLLRRLQHDSIGDMNWIPIEVGRTNRPRKNTKFPPADRFAPRGSSAIVRFCGPVWASGYGWMSSPRATPGRRWRPSHNSAARSGCGRDWRGRRGLRCSCRNAANASAATTAAVGAQASGTPATNPPAQASPSPPLPLQPFPLLVRPAGVLPLAPAAPPPPPAHAATAAAPGCTAVAAGKPRRSG